MTTPRTKNIEKEKRDSRGQKTQKKKKNVSTPRTNTQKKKKTLLLKDKKNTEKDKNVTISRTKNAEKGKRDYPEDKNLRKRLKLTKGEE